MTIRHLQIFQQVCKTGSITKAAEQLFISQPAVSKAVRELESYTGTPLFDRINQKIFLNESGKRLYEKVNDFLDTYREMDEHLKSLETSSVLRLGTGITVANDSLPGIAKAFRDIYPDASLQVTVNQARIVSHMLFNGELDLALLEGAITHPQLTVIPVGAYRLLPVCSPAHPLAASRKVTLDQFLSQPLLLREKGSAVRDTLDSYLLLQDRAAEPYWTSVNSQALIHAAMENLGISILPEILVADLITAGRLRVLPMKGQLELTNSISIVYLKQKKHSKMMKKLISIIQSNA